MYRAITRPRNVKKSVDQIIFDLFLMIFVRENFHLDKAKQTHNLILLNIKTLIKTWIFKFVGYFVFFLSFLSFLSFYQQSRILFSIRRFCRSVKIKQIDDSVIVDITISLYITLSLYMYLYDYLTIPGLTST